MFSGDYMTKNRMDSGGTRDQSGCKRGRSAMRWRTRCTRIAEGEMQRHKFLRQLYRRTKRNSKGLLLNFDLSLSKVGFATEIRKYKGKRFFSMRITSLVFHMANCEVTIKHPSKGSQRTAEDNEI